MRQKKMSVIAIGLALGGLLLFYQNMTLKDFDSLGISDVDDSSRREQARELLGRYYKGSYAQKLEGQPYLSYLVFKQVDQALKAKWKGKVPALVQTVISESQAHEFDPVFVLAVIRTESEFNPEAIGSSGEIGLMQIKPKTGEWLARKFKLPWRGPETLRDPVSNVRIGIRYFAYLRSDFSGRASHYVPAYNMGPKNMRKLASGEDEAQVQTRDYAVRVMKNYFAIYEQLLVEHRKLEKFALAERMDSPAPSEIR